MFNANSSEYKNVTVKLPFFHSLAGQDIGQDNSERLHEWHVGHVCLIRSPLNILVEYGGEKKLSWLID